MSYILIQYGFLTALALFVGGAVASLIADEPGKGHSSSLVAHAFAALGGLAGLLSSGAIILSGTTVVMHALSSIGIAPLMLSLRIDALAAFFIFLISIVTIAASVYGIGYQKQFYGIYSLGSFGFFYNIFIASMFLVVAADNALLFLLAWEIMAIASYFLVIFERHEESNIQAGMLYILITQIGTVFLFAAFLLLYRHSGSWDFASMRAAAPSVSPLLENVILALALVGFGAKAGMIPLHIWLPEAHPAAPSHVSALMSGVMIKTAIFMIIRFFIGFFPAVSSVWGLIILLLGAISALLGVLYALSEHDIKRLLAFHSVENIGIILLGIGASIVFFAEGAPILGIIALSAALYHTINHAIFKGLLFLSAGSVVHAAATRNMEKYGGLIKAMPWTAVFFLIGAVAISGLPPFNGFASEWLTFQSLFIGIASLSLWAKIVFLAGAASLAFTGGLAAACFVKAFGISFLARPRSKAGAHAHEAGFTMLFGMGFLAALTLVFGVGAGTIIPLLARIAEGLIGVSAGPLVLSAPSRSIGLGDFSSLSMPVIAFSIAVGIAAAWLGARLAGRARRVVIRRTWDCGSPLTSRSEITPTGFSRTIITIFKALLRPVTETDTEYHDDTAPYLAKSKTVHLSLPDIYRAYLYSPAAGMVALGAHKAKRVQTGNLNTYLLYTFVTLIVLLFWALH